uniref:LigA n=1 Tax=Parastrongyloides trichosuri TaxID=131310 RepID=A0A0N4ZGR2_PARTI
MASSSARMAGAAASISASQTTSRRLPVIRSSEAAKRELEVAGSKPRLASPSRRPCSKRRAPPRRSGRRRLRRHRSAGSDAGRFRPEPGRVRRRRKPDAAGGRLRLLDLEPAVSGNPDLRRASGPAPDRRERVDQPHGLAFSRGVFRHRLLDRDGGAEPEGGQRHRHLRLAPGPAAADVGQRAHDPRDRGDGARPVVRDLAAGGAGGVADRRGAPEPDHRGHRVRGPARRPVPDRLGRVGRGRHHCGRYRRDLGATDPGLSSADRLGSGRGLRGRAGG